MRTIGTFFELGGRAAMECLTRVGLDYVIIDTEHNCFAPEQVAHYIQAAENGGLIPYVRIGDVRRPSVLQMLDIGARGIIVPDITTVDQVKELVTYAKFPPVGNRGFCPNRTSGWGTDPWAQDIEDYMAESNRRVKVIPQCETAESLEHIEEIAALPGVDGIFVGPCDLSIALGIPLQFDAPAMDAALDRVVAACRKYGKEAMVFTFTEENAGEMFRRGFDSVTCGLDFSVFTRAYQGMVSACRDAAESSGQ